MKRYTLQVNNEYWVKGAVKDAADRLPPLDSMALVEKLAGIFDFGCCLLSVPSFACAAVLLGLFQKRLS